MKIPTTFNMKTLTITLLTFFITGLIAQPSNFTATSIGGGGALFAPSINPYNNDDIFMVCDMAGVFRTTNAGQSWTMFHYEELISTNRAKVQFTSDPNIMYTLRFREGGLYRLYPVKSTDGGNTWNAMNPPLPIDDGIYWYLYADPNSTQRLVISTNNGLWFSNDGGDSFTEIHTDNDGAFGQLYTAGAFWDGNNIYIGLDKGLLVSTDGGANFSLDNTPGLPDDTGFFSFAGAKQGGITRLFGTLAPADQLLMEQEAYTIGNHLGLYQVDYGNGNWTQNTNFTNGETPYLVDLPKDNINIVYTIALRNDDLPNVYKSVNGGASWTNTFLAPNNQNVTTGYAGHFGDYSWFWGGSAIAMDVADNDPNHVVITDFGFVHGTQDGGNTWRQMYVAASGENPSGSETPNGQFYQSSGIRQITGYGLTWLNDQEIFLHCGDISSQYSNDGGLTWSFAREDHLKSNTYRIVQHPTNTNTLFKVSTNFGADIYLEYVLRDDLDDGDGVLMRSLDAGVNWTVFHDFGNIPVWLEMDPFNSNIMYVSIINSTTGGIYKTIDGGDNWSKLPNPPRTEGHPNVIRILSNGDLVVSFSARINGNDEYTQSAGVFYSQDGGNTWSDRTAPAMQYYTVEVDFDRNNENTWYASVWDHFDNNGRVPNGGLYKTTNQGVSWTRIFQYEQTQSATVHPENSNEIYVALEGGGLYYSSNATAATPSFSKVQAFPYSRAKRIVFNPNNIDEMWVTTMGGDFWKSDIVMSIADEEKPIETTEPVFQLLSSTPNPFSEQTLIRFELPKKRTVTIQIYDSKGVVMKTIEQRFEKGLNEVLVGKEDLGSMGVYFFKIQSGGFSAIGKLVLK